MGDPWDPHRMYYDMKGLHAPHPTCGFGLDPEDERFIEQMDLGASDTVVVFVLDTKAGPVCHVMPVPRRRMDS